MQSVTLVANIESVEGRLGRLEQTLATVVARVYELERAAPQRYAPQPVAQQPEQSLPPPSQEAVSLESTLGTYWLSRIGIVSLITGAALLIITYFGELGAALRVGLGYAMAAGVVWIGARLSVKHETFGRVVLSGGLAIGYFVTYALHFVPAMQIIESEPIGVALVAVAIAVIVATAHKLQSETVAGIALFLGLHTGMLSEVTALSLVCTTLLAAGAGFFMAANRWVVVPLSTIVAVYATHASLAFGAGVGLAPGLSLAVLVIDFTLFSGAALFRPDLRAGSLVLIALLNWLGVLVLGGHAFHTFSNDSLCWFLCGFSAVHALLALASHANKGPRAAVQTLLALALITAGLALPVQLRDGVLVGGWLLLALGCAAVARRAGWAGFAGLALALLLVANTYAYFDLHGVPAQLACVVVCLAIERISGEATGMRPVFVMGIAAGLMGVCALGLPPDTATIGWVGVAFAMFATGFALKSSAYRWAGFGVLGISAMRFGALQLGELSANQKIITFVVAGVALLVVSFLYTRRRAQR